MQMVELNVYDLNELEEHFEKDELDLMFTFREPSKQKLKFTRTLGYQTLKSGGEKSGPWVGSQYEFSSQKKIANRELPVLLSNSLQVRRHWIDNKLGFGVLPSEVRHRKSHDEDVPVILIAASMFNAAMWKRIEQFRL